MGPVREKDVYANGEGEKARNCEDRDSCEDAMPDFHLRVWPALATCITRNEPTRRTRFVIGEIDQERARRELTVDSLQYSVIWRARRHALPR